MELHNLHKEIGTRITNRLKEFDDIWENANYKKIFEELTFCIFTPQSKAHSCWKAVEMLKEKDLLFNGSSEQISDLINIVRFRRRKSQYMVEAREKFANKEFWDNLKDFKDNISRREWLVQNVKGYGYKEASHFLRNIGKGQDIAILDRHILKNLVVYGIIKEVPKTITKNIYLDMEKKMMDFSKKIKIPMDQLDFLLWYKEAKDIFK